MGQFSWLDCKTGEQILDDVRRNVYVLVPVEFGGGHIEEKCYDGYGNFGGIDIYDLVVDWNRNYIGEVLEQKDTWVCDWVRDRFYDDLVSLSNGEEMRAFVRKRDIGIALACYDEDNARLRYPIKITHDATAKYEWNPPSKSDPNQGWLYEDEWEEEE